ncbi:hypothetical protein F4821DRAFT_249854 [Hypoxylon rubiginosum]|uniref:Uncharacterized protein n=1 Tax=Hypoxylon rubiginosum TaxID=110542 RepID=A0ACC0CLC9_9PEZI|nr:hypothetical protein F4821DRAFT_249854 [Hypoxylon rubiginosum]
MALSNETIVGIISLLIMCLPIISLLVRLFRHHRARTLIPLEPIPEPDDLASLEAGMLYARQIVRVDTIVVRPMVIPHFRWPFRHRRSSPEAIRT